MSQMNQSIIKKIYTKFQMKLLFLIIFISISKLNLKKTDFSNKSKTAKLPKKSKTEKYIDLKGSSIIYFRNKKKCN